MLFIPLPFVVALLLVILLLQMIRRREVTVLNPFFSCLIAAYALQSIVIGLRWGYDLMEVLPVQAVLAAAIASLAWLSFEGLRTERSPLERPLLWLHSLPPLLVVALVAFWPAPISLMLILIFAGYGVALICLASAGTDVLSSARLEGVINSHRALQVTAFAIAASAVIDVIISLDFAWSGGIHSGKIVAIGNVLAMLVLGTAATVAGTNQSPADVEVDDNESTSRPSVEDTQISASLDDLMQSRTLYRDVDLNLNRLARKMGLSVRQVSSAVNRVKSMSVSQYVNDYRVREACRSLTETEEPITRIMFDAGFQTKSNFNREFLRVTGMSPKAWRARAIVKPDEKTAKIIRLVG
ncbi:helix-turn-helix domain-containing protein [Phyllobacterium endophyticum]|uniref:AraC family transcriptional regulator n=1 Tax=Phyllobacterium endophyticum TaxID=1149773 RepID=A0A2P7AXA5_9HYPH|nr:AraC family transcriptional regulator [Phyllobacterium endophyticum]MBB3235246.1 AraC-like DNA-binding protein [Phyllobacterium endophyticum]PSH58850.1 AraC family transcriptional regulator [Phyllobacterium endophyticum]TYR39302.1 helix-turn-helix transcriptional regulator [Phyllobacterium endophyticum]